MPYRRLPNTDQTRLRAMRKAFEMIDKDAYDQAIPFDLQYQLKMLYPQFQQAVDLYRQAFQRQLENSKEYKEAFRVAKLYVSHFLQVMNMAIQRGELPESVREEFGLPAGSTSLPRLQTEKDLLTWGKQIIEAEEKRIARGQTPIQNPRIALVKVYFEKFTDAYFFYKKSQEITAQNLNNVAQLRPKVDRLIQKIWNAVEDYYKDLPPEEMREKAQQYGVVYVYRKSERMAEMA